MTLHIGIVGCSAEGASLCYRTICSEGAELLCPHAHPEVSMHTPPLRDYVTCLEESDIAGVAELMLASAHKLAAPGADFLICPDNTIHQAMSLAVPRSPLPWLHIAEVVAEECVRKGFSRLGLTGTKWLVESDVYPDALSRVGITLIRSDGADRDEVNRIIMEELVYGRFKPRSIATLQRIIEGMREDGCEAVVLGCTELPLVINDENAVLPTLDSTRLLARAALQHAIGSDALRQG